MTGKIIKDDVVDTGCAIDNYAIVNHDAKGNCNDDFDPSKSLSVSSRLGHDSGRARRTQGEARRGEGEIHSQGGYSGEVLR